MQREIDDRWVVRKLIILVGRICEKMCVEIFRLLGETRGRGDEIDKRETTESKGLCIRLRSMMKMMMIARPLYGNSYRER